jgi:RNA polymerase sigma-70 factor (ECF subfamily)
MDDNETLRQLLKHRSELLGFIMAIVRDSHLAEDLFQSVALAIVKQAQTDVVVEDFPAWAKQIARHHIWNYYRQQKSHQTVPVPVEEMAEIVDHAFASSAPDAMELAEEYEAVLNCLQKMPERAANIVKRHFIAGLRYSELAKELKMKENALRQALLRARLLLVDCVRSHLGGLPMKRGI